MRKVRRFRVTLSDGMDFDVRFKVRAVSHNRFVGSLSDADLDRVTDHLATALKQAGGKTSTAFNVLQERR